MNLRKYSIKELIKKYPVNKIVRSIDNTILKPNATLNDIKRVCELSIKYNFIGCCIPPIYVRTASNILDGTNVKLITVCGFPLGYNTTATKIKEVEEAFVNGANEVDVVANISFIKSGDYQRAFSEIEKLVDISKAYGGIIKIIVETSLLTNIELINAVKIVETSGADYIKTNTGFGPRGVSIHDILLIRETTKLLKIKAAGGIRHISEVLLYLDLGVDRIGTSAGVDIIKEYNEFLNKV